MKITTYGGKKIECEIFSFRPLLPEEIKKYDDGSEKKIGELPGSGDLITSRISEYYIAAIKINGEHQTAFVHADDIIKSSESGSVYCGYRMGSLNIFHRAKILNNGQWYNRRVDENEGETQVLGSSMAENLTHDQINLICDHVSGAINIDDKIAKAQSDLINAKKHPEHAYKGVFEELLGSKTTPEETDTDFAWRLCNLAETYKNLLECKKQIGFESFKLVK
jgi:hypothetical protein